MSKKQPHPILLDMLQGPKVPKEFVCDGCSMSPDGYWYWACRIHDYEASQLRWMWTSIYHNRDDSNIIKYTREKYWVRSQLAKQHLKDNIRILSVFYVKNGQLRTRRFFNPKRLLGWQAASLYAGVTGGLFKWQTKGTKKQSS